MRNTYLICAAALALCSCMHEADKVTMPPEGAAYRITAALEAPASTKGNIADDTTLDSFSWLIACGGVTLYSGSGYWYWRWSGAGSSASSSKSSESSAEKSNPGFSFSLNPVQTGKNNAVIKTTVSNPNRINVTKVGCVIYDADGKKIKKHYESCVRNESTFYIWYDIAAELGLSLNSNTTYKYKIFVVHDGSEYFTKKGSFTTSK